jgi:hypothetical protein
MTTKQNDPRIFSNQHGKVSIAAFRRAELRSHPAMARANAARNKYLRETVLASAALFTCVVVAAVISVHMQVPRPDQRDVPVNGQSYTSPM